VLQQDVQLCSSNNRKANSWFAATGCRRHAATTPLLNPLPFPSPPLATVSATASECATGCAPASPPGCTGTEGQCARVSGRCTAFRSSRAVHDIVLTGQRNSLQAHLRLRSRSARLAGLRLRDRLRDLPRDERGKETPGTEAQDSAAARQQRDWAGTQAGGTTCSTGFGNGVCSLQEGEGRGHQHATSTPPDAHRSPAVAHAQQSTAQGQSAPARESTATRCALPRQTAEQRPVGTREPTPADARTAHAPTATAAQEAPGLRSRSSFRLPWLGDLGYPCRVHLCPPLDSTTAKLVSLSR
jgi:hypothetical protein